MGESFFDKFVVSGDMGSDALPAKKVEQKLPSLSDIREIREAYKATAIDLAEPPKIESVIVELGREQFTQAVKKLFKSENWERVWWATRTKYTTELAKAEENILAKAAFDVTKKFDEYITQMVADVDKYLPAVMAQLAENVEFMNNKDRLAYAKLLIDLRKDYLDRVTEGKDKVPGNETKTQQETQKSVLNELGLLADIAATLRGKVTDEEVIDAEFSEEAEEVRRKVFATLDG
jgi:hypothetical protein